MQRNLGRRIEVCFPLYAPHVRDELRALLSLQLGDNVKARVLDRAQKNRYAQGGAPPLRAQLETYRYFETRLGAREPAPRRSALT
jgi:polyphosphate kinase